MDVRPLAMADAQRMRKAIMAFLEGERDINWIVGVIQAGGDAEAVRQFVSELSGYGDPQRRDYLLSRLGEAA